MTLEDFNRISLRIIKDLIENNMELDFIESFDFNENSRAVRSILLEEFGNEDLFYQEDIEDDYFIKD